MEIVSVMPFDSLKQMCLDMNAPVFPRKRVKSGRTFLVRRPGCSVQEEERFFASLTKDERIVNES